MSMDWNDPRLTAYALGEELSAQDLKQMEALVKESKEARDYVRSVQETASLLSTELAKETLPETGGAKSEKKKSSTPWYKLPIVNPYLGVAVASLVAILIAVPVFKKSMQEETPELAAHIDGLRPDAEEPAALETQTTATPGATQQPQVQAPAEIAALEDAPAQDAMANKGASQVSDTLARVRGQDAGMMIAAAPAKKMEAGYGRAGGAGGLGRAMPTAASLAQQNFAPEGQNTESYAHVAESDFVKVSEHPLSTFSTDVDTASYAIVRRYLQSGALPPVDAVRIEEMINYFPYAYAPPKDNKPFAVHVEQASAPWMPEHKLVRIGLKGKEIDLRKRPKSNLVFLIDVSGSMNDENKLPLLKNAMRALVEKLNDNDRVAMVVYAGASGLALPPTSNKSEILAALDKLDAGGSTNGGEGIELAYKVAQENFIANGTNRVILATDGDFNVGTTSEGELIRLIERKAKSKVFLTVLGFGSGNYKDSAMEKLADKGNGNYAYIDTMQEAKKVLVEQIGGTLVTIAKDVKIQVEFNPKFASAYRLIGYENRKLNKEDFNDDTTDAGEIGAGHTVTALYEVVPAGQEIPTPSVDALKYQKTKAAPPSAEQQNDSNELLTVKLRYKKPEGDTSELIEVPVPNEERNFAHGSKDFKFAAAVAEFGMLLRDSKWKGKSGFQDIKHIVSGSQGFFGKKDELRAEFMELVKKAEQLKKRDH